MGPSGSSEEFCHTLVSAHKGARKHGNCESHTECSLFHLYNLKPFHYTAALNFL